MEATGQRAGQGGAIETFAYRRGLATVYSVQPTVRILPQARHRPAATVSTAALIEGHCVEMADRFALVLNPRRSLISLLQYHCTCTHAGSGAHAFRSHSSATLSSGCCSCGDSNSQTSA